MATHPTNIVALICQIGIKMVLKLYAFYLMPIQDVEVVLVPIAEVLLKIVNREICVTGSITAIFLA